MSEGDDVSRRCPSCPSEMSNRSTTSETFAVPDSTAAFEAVGAAYEACGRTQTADDRRPLKTIFVEDVFFRLDHGGVWDEPPRGCDIGSYEYAWTEYTIPVDNFLVMKAKFPGHIFALEVTERNKIHPKSGIHVLIWEWVCDFAECRRSSGVSEGHLTVDFSPLHATSDRSFRHSICVVFVFYRGRRVRCRSPAVVQLGGS